MPVAAQRPLDAAEVLSTYAAGLGDAPDGTLYQALALACRGAYRDADQLLEAAISNTEQAARSQGKRRRHAPFLAGCLRRRRARTGGDRLAGPTPSC